MKYKITTYRFKDRNWHYSLSIDLFEYCQYWVARITMFYDPKLSSEVLREYLPPDVVERIFIALENAADGEEAEVEFHSESLPSWPWKPDARALKEACIYTGTSEKPETFLTFIEDGFRLKIKLEGRIDRHFPTELSWMAGKLWRKFRSNPLAFHAISKEEPHYVVS